jgi:hypothetical protein
MAWEDELRHRLGGFDGTDGLAVSIKVRPTSGCFCRSCCPNANRLIGEARQKLEREGDFRFEEHETGPEILMVCAATTAGFAFATAVVNFFTAVINARTAGRKKGDRREEPIELIVRGFDKDGNLFEEKVLRIQTGDETTREIVAKALNEAVQKQLPAPTAAPKSKGKKKAKK